MPIPNFLEIPVPDPEAAVLYGGAIRGILTPQVGAVVQNDEYGLDMLTRPYFGFTDEIYGLIPPEGTPDDFLPHFKLVSYQVQEGRGLQSTALLTYKGLIHNQLPAPRVRGGYSETSVQLSTIRNRGDFALNGIIDLALGNNGGGVGADGLNVQRQEMQAIVTRVAQAAQDPQNVLARVIVTEWRKSLQELQDEESGEVTVSYNSPTTTFMYVSKEEPMKPRYEGQLLASDGDFEVLDITPASFKGRPVCNKEVRTIRFEKEKSGSYWECMQVNQGRLVNLKTAMRGFNAAGGFPMAPRKEHILSLH